MNALIRAETATGVRYELRQLPADELSARRVVSRVARFLGQLGCRATWSAGRVTATDLGSGRLLFVARITPNRDGQLCH